MNILIAPDSFKGTFRAPEMAEMIRKALPAKYQENLTLVPLGDGGEGTAEIIGKLWQARPISAQVRGPYQTPVTATYYVAGDKAILDMASASGLVHVKAHELQPYNATTYGTGELMKKALAESGVKKLYVGLGGSATVDGGAGALMALGARLLDKHNRPISLGHIGLKELFIADLEPAIQAIKTSEITLLADVKNPLLGQHGAIFNYGIQKGILKENLSDYEDHMAHYANYIESALQKKDSNLEGSGAAGGLGFGLISLGATTLNGMDYISELVQLNEKIQHADLVITGEGQVNKTSFMGKVTGTLYGKCKTYNKRLIMISGGIIKNNFHLKSDSLCEYVELFNENKDNSCYIKQTQKILTEVLHKIL
jgi:glycerate kinase